MTLALDPHLQTVTPAPEVLDDSELSRLHARYRDFSGFGTIVASHRELARRLETMTRRAHCAEQGRETAERRLANAGL